MVQYWQPPHTHHTAVNSRHLTSLRQRSPRLLRQRCRHLLSHPRIAMVDVAQQQLAPYGFVTGILHSYNSKTGRASSGLTASSGGSSRKPPCNFTMKPCFAVCSHARHLRTYDSSAFGHGNCDPRNATQCLGKQGKACCSDPVAEPHQGVAAGAGSHLSLNCAPDWSK